MKPATAVLPATAAAIPGVGWFLPLLCIWLLTLVTFSAPGREGPNDASGVDAIALAKIVTRFFVLVVLGAALLNRSAEPRFRAVCGSLAPLGLFLVWTFVSAAWSPLRSVSVGQSVSLLVQTVLAAHIALLWSGTEDLSRLLAHLCGALLAVSLCLLAAYVWSPEASGLVRGLEIEGSLGIMHPTSAGATASLGILLLLLVRMLTDWRWPRLLLLPGLVGHGLVLFLAASRTALSLTAVLTLIVLLGHLPRAVVAVAACFLALVGTVYLALDPQLDLADRAYERARSYWKRGESAEQMQSFNGRTELWQAVWASYQESPLVGHGYFVSSRDGLLDVWSGPANRTAHNTLLQVLVSTGFVGLALFLWGLVRVVAAGWGRRRDMGGDMNVPLFFGLVGVWYLGWGQLSESFMGPLQPESVVFFSLLGAWLGAAIPGTPAETEGAGADLEPSADRAQLDREALG